MQAGAATPFQPAAGQAVYGLNIQNGRLATLTKRVLTMALLSAILVIIGQVARIVIGQDKSLHTIAASLLAMGCGLLIPCCGYFGAKNSSRELTCCFCGCNCLLSILNIVSLVIAGLSYVGFKFLMDNCEPDNVQSTCKQNLDWVQTCNNMGHPVDTPEQCWQYFHDTIVPSLVTAAIVTAVCCVPSFILQCFSFVWGKQLYDALQEGQVIHAAPRAPVMTTFPAQPVVAMPAMPAQPVNPIPGQQVR